MNPVPSSVLRTALPLAAALALLAACGGDSSPAGSGSAPSAPAAQSAQPAARPVAAPAPPAAPAAAPAKPSTPAEEAQFIFTSRCVTCHGQQGKGDGPGSLGLVPPPRDLSNADWQASVTDEHIEKIVAFGGIAVGKSAAMPPNPDLMGKKAVLAELRAKVRSLKKP